MKTNKIYFKTSEKFKNFCMENNVSPSVVDVGFGDCIGARLKLENELIIAVLDAAEYTNAPHIEKGE